MSSAKDLIDFTNLPQHVAIIMDGNGRWAKTRGQDRTYGHRSAISSVRDAINACNEVGIPYLTLYTFSTENWNRPLEEITTLMELLAETLLAETEEIMTKGLRLHVIGQMHKLPQILQDQLQEMVSKTKNHQGGNLILALSYGAREEILDATRQIAKEVQQGHIKIEDIGEDLFSSRLYTRDFPDVDLLIRTSGEVRISNFLLWQLAYAEMQFLELLWPDFTRETFYQCIADYQKKERRFGLTGEQIKQTS